MHFLRCSIPLKGNVVAVVTRPAASEGHSHHSFETLLILCKGFIRQLLGSGVDGRGGLELGPTVELKAAKHAAKDCGSLPLYQLTSVTDACWDPFSNCIYLIDGCAIVRLCRNNCVTLVAGVTEQGEDEDGVGNADGRGCDARFWNPTAIVSDGSGFLYTADGVRVRRLRLPNAWRAGLPNVAPSTPEASGSQQQSPKSAVGLPASPASGPPPEVQVTTLDLDVNDNIEGLAYEPVTNSLVYADSGVLYRLPLGHGKRRAAEDKDNAGNEDGADGIDTRPAVVLAGSDQESSLQDGVGRDAHFGGELCGLVADGAGCIYLLDEADDRRVRTIRKVVVAAAAAQAVGGNASTLKYGTVTTLVRDLPRESSHLAVLPSGILACAVGSKGLQLLDVGATRPRYAFTSANDTPPEHTLHADLAALLARQPDGTADVTVVVGERSFSAHSVLLTTRSGYFRQRLVSGFVSATGEHKLIDLSLPGADSDAFAFILRYMYTNDADVPLKHLPKVMELTDRLLLPGLHRKLQKRFLASVTPDTVVDLMLWADERGPAYTGLLEQLTAWCVENLEAVWELAAEQISKLPEESPALYAKLMTALEG